MSRTDSSFLIMSRMGLADDLKIYILKKNSLGWNLIAEHWSPVVGGRKVKTKHFYFQNGRY